MIPSGQSDFLNLTRWLSAFLVVCEHLRSLLFQDFSKLSDKDVFDYGFYFVTGFGHEAVVLFFVLSGFLVGGNVLKKWENGSFEWKGYLIDRATRLYTVYLFVLVFGVALDGVGYKWFNSAGYYSQSTPDPIATLAFDVSARLDVWHFLSSLIMGQEIILPSVGSNGPLWSLAHEWWYYVLFPLILGVFRGRLARRIVALTLVSVVLLFLTKYVLVLFGVWLLGVVVWRYNHRRLVPLCVALPVFLGALFIMRIEIISIPYVSQFILGAGFSLLLNSVCQNNKPLFFCQFSKFMADFSYSLYLVHFPFILFLVSVGSTYGFINFRLQPNLLSIVIFTIIMVLSLCFAYLVSLATEAKTADVRMFVRKIIGD